MSKLSPKITTVIRLYCQKLSKFDWYTVTDRVSALSRSHFGEVIPRQQIVDLALFVSYLFHLG